MPQARSIELDTGSDPLTLQVGGLTLKGPDLGVLEDQVHQAFDDGLISKNDESALEVVLGQARREELASLVDHAGLSQAEISRRLGKADNFIRRKTAEHGAQVYMADIYAVRGLIEQLQQ